MQQIKVLLEAVEFLDKRNIVKFDKQGIPYQKEVPIGGIKTLTKALEERVKTDKNPIIVVGDMSGMQIFNNEYGRETADQAIEKTLTLFSNEMKKIGVPVSPSGDEMWLLPDVEIEPEEIVKSLVEFLIKLNRVGLTTKRGKKGLNAKFYIGRKHFADVESILKTDEKGNKLPPGTIKIDKSLVGEKKDKIINDENVSDAKVINLKEVMEAMTLWGFPFKDCIDRLTKKELELQIRHIEFQIEMEGNDGKPTGYLEKYLESLKTALVRRE